MDNIRTIPPSFNSNQRLERTNLKSPYPENATHITAPAISTHCPTAAKSTAKKNCDLQHKCNNTVI
jgi:hypothetical protein